MGSVERIHNKLTVEDHLLIILMKLRLGLCNTDLAYTVSKITISNILRSWVPAISLGYPAMAFILKSLIKWPSKGAVLKNMPKIIKCNFKRCRCIIDCTEIFIARPSSLTARAQTWSNYKHNNTIKYLIAITPADELAAYGATLRIPHFTKGKKQLSAQEVDTARQLSRVRIHVERVIGWWKKFKILQTVIPVSQVNILDDVIVCGRDGHFKTFP
ncbi:hypothetical protein N1851_005166 [Merluccius polli]|uniref:DDE Tnp4 domain-containing protein n=1 Tax=Merluccius polli TaxID=89951 RepID=A0AA47N6I7_MERPO|nr:hypothetical protein N1851_005166 [Merluccius polli]